MSPKARNIGYAVATTLFCLAMLPGAIANLIKAQAAAELMAALGYPLYLLPFLGVAKLLGVLALAVPGRKILKEWAYAGFAYDLLGATYSHLNSGGGLGAASGPLVLLFVAVLSYVWRPASRRV